MTPEEAIQSIKDEEARTMYAEPSWKEHDFTRNALIIKALKHLRDHELLGIDEHTVHKCLARNDPDFRAWVQQEYDNLHAAKQKFACDTGMWASYDARCRSLASVLWYLGPVDQQELPPLPIPESEWTTSPQCPWCGTFHNPFLGPGNRSCNSCGKWFEVEERSRFRTHKVGRLA
jgi:hypothetical protein